MPFIIGKTITETFLKRVEATPHLIGYQYKDGTEWKDVTFRQFHDRCRLISFGLMGLGLKPGDRAAILSNSRFEWSLFDMAILGAKAITVPIYASSTSRDVGYILRHSEATLLIVEDAKQLEKLRELRKDAPLALARLQTIVVIDSLGVSARPEDKNDEKIVDMPALLETAGQQEAREPALFEQNLRSAAPEDLFTICYTSGTTGIPKGAMLDHGNMMSVLDDCVAHLSRFVNPDAEVILSFLPFSHILGKCESIAGHTFGWCQGFAESPEKFMTNVTEVRPTLIFSVPRFFEKASSRIRAELKKAPLPRRKAFEWGIQAGRHYWAAIEKGEMPSWRDILEYGVASKVVFSQVHERFGGRLRFAICGGAPLPPEIGRFFQAIGIKILEGYGLTETCAPVAVNTPDRPRFETVGKPLPEVTIKVAEDGEILVRSRKVFRGYYKNQEDTAAAMDEGWLRTGDIGRIDNEGFLYITDRKKDLIITSAGKNIAPQKIESLALGRPFISQFVVHGDGRHFLTALITLDQEQVIKYASENHILFSGYSELIKHARIMGIVQKTVDDVNRELASFETIKKFVVLPNDFTIESGELTPSLKVRRDFVNQKYKDLLDAMYAP
jgi:long-chain acyl-CoA synthetase